MANCKKPLGVENDTRQKEGARVARRVELMPQPLGIENDTQQSVREGRQKQIAFLGIENDTRE